MELKNLIFREIINSDFTNYMNLMFEFTNYNHNINQKEFRVNNISS
jgi:hypothetical protein